MVPKKIRDEVVKTGCWLMVLPLAVLIAITAGYGNQAGYLVLVYPFWVAAWFVRFLVVCGL